MTPSRRALSVWVRLARAYAAVLRIARRAVEPDLTLAQFDVLAQLARAGARCTAGDLSRMLLVTAGNVTGLVDRLAARGLVRRARDPADRRRAFVRLTSRGRAAWRRARARHATALADTLRRLDPGTAERLRRDLARLRAAVAPRVAREGAA